MNIKDEKKQPLLNLPLEQKKKMLVMQNKNKTESGKTVQSTHWGSFYENTVLQLIDLTIQKTT